MGAFEPPWTKTEPDPERHPGIVELAQLEDMTRQAYRDRAVSRTASPWLPMLRIAQQAGHEVILFLENGMSFRGIVSNDREIGGIDLTEPHPVTAIRDLARITLVPKGGTNVRDAPRWHVVLLAAVVALTEVNR